MIVRNLLVASTLISCAFFNAQQITYLDDNWEVTTKDKMHYYREVEPNGRLTLIKDYYKSGKLQMQGHAVDPTLGEEVYDGEVSWYREDGKIQSLVTYKNGEQVGKSLTYDEKGRVISDMFYSADGNYSGKMYSYEDKDYPTSVNSYSEYKAGNILREVTYANSMNNGIRMETIYKNGYDHFETKSYDLNNKVIATGEYKDGKYKGTFAEFYAQPMQLLLLKKYDKNDQIIEQTYYYRNGNIAQETVKKGTQGQETTFDKTGNTIGKLAFKFEDDYFSPYNGTEYTFLYASTDISSIREYKNGQIIVERYYNDETKRLESENFYEGEYANLQKSIFYDYNTGAKKGELIYKDSEPYEGVFYSFNNESVYKDGKLLKSKNYGFDRVLISESELSADGSKYYGKIYNEDQKLHSSYVADANADGFDAEVSQYENGKVVRTAKIKNSIFVDGKIVTDSSQGKVEYERVGDWRYIRTYDENQQLIEETKKRVSDDYSADAFYITEDYLTNVF